MAHWEVFNSFGTSMEDQLISGFADVLLFTRLVGNKKNNDEPWICFYRSPAQQSAGDIASNANTLLPAAVRAVKVRNSGTDEYNCFRVLNFNIRLLLASRTFC